MSKIKLIGLSGNARVGKDFLCQLLGKYNDEKTVRIALADKLKEQIHPFLVKNLNISAWTTNANEKKLIRPLLVEFGRVQRIITKGKHWTSLVTPDIEYLIARNKIPVVSDVRYFDEYPEDEFYWLKKMGGVLVYIDRIDQDGNLVPPPNQDEAENNPKLKAKADFHITWETKGNIDDLIPFVPKELLTL